MKTHRKDQTKEKQVQCDICKKTFIDEKGILRHMQKVHEKDPPERKVHDQFIADNFDMSCDQCEVKFTAFYDARQHYKEKHNEDSGYIKCCGEKLKALVSIRDHINKHLNPETTK